MQNINKTVAEIADKRGESTRVALVQAGLELFGEYGFKGTTTRMLCDRAGANISSIPYYFDSKKGLYLAVMEYIVERIQGHFGELHSNLNGLTQPGSLSQEQAIIALKKMIRTIAQLFVESDEPKSWVQLIMREQANPTEAFDIIYEGQMKHVQRMLSTLIATSTGLSPESDEVKIRCHALIGQILIFTISRESLLRHLNVRKLTTEHIDMIYSILLEHAEACLTINMSDRSS